MPPRRFIVFESALFRTNSTLVETEDFLLLADPTWLLHEIRAIRQVVDSKKDSRKLYLLFTHSDYDHILGAGAFPDFSTMASKAFTENPLQSKIMEEIHNFDHQYYLRRHYPIYYPEIDFCIHEGLEKLDFSHSSMHFFQTPGHNPDGLALLIQPDGILIAGDYLSNEEFPFIYHNAWQYIQTLQKMEKLVEAGLVKWLIPGHGDTASEIHEMRKRFVESYFYLKSAILEVIIPGSFPHDWLWSRYHFRKSQSDFHQKNLELIKKELSNKGLVEWALNSEIQV